MTIKVNETVVILFLFVVMEHWISVCIILSRDVIITDMHKMILCTKPSVVTIIIIIMKIKKCLIFTAIDMKIIF